VSDILSSEELGALIDAFRDPSEAEGNAIAPTRAHESDPASEVRLNEAQLAALRLIHGSFAWAAEAALADYLGPALSINLSWQSQMEFRDYLPRCEHSLIATVSAPPLKGRLLLELNYSTAQRMLDHYFKGTVGAAGRREFNEVELKVLQDAIERVLAGYAESWRQVAKIKPSVKVIESFPGSNPVALPADPVVVAALEIRIGAYKELMTLCLPNQVFKPFLAGVATRSGSAATDRAAVLELQGDMSGLAQVEISGTMDDGFAPGAVVQLGNAGSVVIVNDGKPVGKGELVVLGGQLAVRVLEALPKRRVRQPRSA